MKIIKRIPFLIAMFLLMLSFSKCSMAQKLQKEPPAKFGKVYYQEWVAGVQGAGSGINLFIPIEETSVVFDSVYFNGKVTKLEYQKDNQLYIGRFKTSFNQSNDIVLSSDLKEEYSNKLPIKESKIPFQLEDDECVVSYQENDKTLYFKISNIIEKARLNYPSSSPDNTMKLN